MAFDDKFQLGGCYLACPTSGMKSERRVAVVVGRQGSRIQFAWVDGLSVALVEDFNREWCQAEQGGQQFTISCAQKIDAYSTAEVMQIVSKGKI